MSKDPKVPGPKIRHAIETLEGSLIRKVAETNIGRDDVIALWFGEPNEPTPDFIKQAAVDALARNETFYTSNNGVRSVRDEVVAYMRRLYGIDMTAIQL